MILNQWIVPMGVAAYITIALAFATGAGLIRFRPPKTHVAIHKILALVGLCLATVHAGIIIYFQFFY